MEEKPICERCQLFDAKKGFCRVLIIPPPGVAEEFGLQKGQKINIPVSAKDECFFEQEFKAIDKEHSNVERFKIEVQQVKVWVENPKTGERCKQGVVKIEYPEGYWGDLDKPKEGKNE